MGWGPHRVSAGIFFFVPPKPWLGLAAPPPQLSIPIPAVRHQQSPMARLRGLPSLVTPRWLSFLVALRWELSLGIHIDIKKGPFVPIN